MDLTVVNQGGNNSLLRDYRKGNWTLQETMVLIEAKKMDNERRMKSNSDRGGGKPAELRWKWVEDYCWKNGCLRSQNQCNDKWDNLMRDFKKVREYERRVEEAKSYWKIEKNERKENHLPSSMLPQVYEVLVEVVDRKSHRTAPAGNGSGGGGSLNVNLQLPPVQHIRPVTQPPPPAVVLPLPPPPQAPSEPPTLPFSQPLPTVDSDTSDYSDSPAKRRKRKSGGGGSGEGTSGGGGGGATLEEVGSAISSSASIIAEAIQSCEEREERRHRELVRLHERRLQIEESKAEINRQGINGLVDAINKLATSIFALATSRNQGPPT